MTTSEEILIIANRLANAGKKPTVALVKTKLSQPVPLALLINTLKGWQHRPEHTELPTRSPVKSSETMTTTNNLKVIEELISKAVEPLHQEIKLLKEQMAVLNDQIKSKN